MQEFYLSDEIIQGEEIPFYILWKGDEIESIKLEMSGFSNFKEVYNAQDYELSNNSLIVTKMETPGYLGGLLSTNISDEPKIDAYLKVKIQYNNGEVKEFIEKRILYTTKIIPKYIPKKLNFSNGQYEKILIDLKGETSVFFNVNELEMNECELDYEPQIKSVILSVREVIHSGFIELKEEYSQYSEFIDYIIELDNLKTISTISEEIEKEIELKYSDAVNDEDFLNSIADILITAILGNVDFKKRILSSTDEYFRETTNTHRVFFRDPLINICSSNDSCKLHLELIATNVLHQQQSEPIQLEIEIEESPDCFTPIVDLFSFRRL